MVTRLATQIAQNQLTDRQPKEALKTLKSGYSHWRRVPEAVETIELRLEYLATMATLAQQLKQKDTLNFASQEAREFQNRLTEHEVRRKAEEERKAAIIEGAEEFLA